MAQSDRTSLAAAAPLGETLSALQERQHSLTVYLEQLLQRIDRVDAQVQAYLPDPDRRERLRAEGAALRERYPNPNRRPPLYGATVGVKDIIHVDGFETRAGTEVPSELFAGDEAVVVQQLRAAGALIAGKTVTTEFAFFEPGPTANPHNLAHTPGGSSSGSAAAVAAGLCTLALGTQTIGSVIRPAAFCGIVGFKPSYNRIATQGIVYFSRTVDHVGLFTQDVEGMRVAASALCAKWRWVDAPNRLPVLGVPDGPYLAQTEDEALAAFEEELLMLQVAGCMVRRVEEFADIAELNELHRRLAFAEFAQEHAAWFEQYEAQYRPRTVEAIRLGQSVGDEELERSRAHCVELREKLTAKMDRLGIDLWVCPAATGPAPAGLDSTGDPNMNLPWTHAGLPAVTLPAGTAANGLPLGMQFVARYDADEELLAWAEWLSDLISEPLED